MRVCPPHNCCGRFINDGVLLAFNNGPSRANTIVMWYKNNATSALLLLLLLLPLSTSFRRGSNNNTHITVAVVTLKDGKSETNKKKKNRNTVENPSGRRKKTQRRSYMKYTTPTDIRRSRRARCVVLQARYSGEYRRCFQDHLLASSSTLGS